MKTLIAASLSLALIGCTGDLGAGKHVQGAYKVVDTGGCNDDTGNYLCAVKVERSKGAGGGFLYGSTYGDVMKGQLLYRECWVENDGPHCFSVFKKRARNQYSAGGMKASTF